MNHIFHILFFAFTLVALNQHLNAMGCPSKERIRDVYETSDGMPYVRKMPASHTCFTDVAPDIVPIKCCRNFLDSCPAPILLRAEALSVDSIALYWHFSNSADTWEIEIMPDSTLFTGNPQFSSIAPSYHVAELLPQTSYFWRIRSVCTTSGVSPWSETGYFQTPADCSNGVPIICDSTISANRGSALNLISTCLPGPEKYYLFTPQYTGDYQLQAYAPGYVAYMATIPGGDCAIDTSWICLGISDPFQIHIWPLGQLTAGTTYPIALDFTSVPEDPNLYGEFTILCPTPCIKPTNPATSNIQATSAHLIWNGQYNQVAWEVEIQPLSEPFTGIANYLSTTDSLQVEGLPDATLLHWRVRGLCGTLGASEWSDEVIFKTLPNCKAYSLLACEETLTLRFGAEAGYWSNLTPCTQTMQGREQILQFTSDGTNRYILIQNATGEFGLYLKNADNSECESPTNWICITKSSNSSMYTIGNLNPGSTYYLLFKNRSNVNSDSIQLSFHCNIPCHNLLHPSVRLTTNGTHAYAHWDGLSTPWKYQIAMRYADGSEFVSPELFWNANGIFLNDLFDLNTSNLCNWRVRSICPSGDTSNWSVDIPFRLFRCNGTTVLPCFDSLQAIPVSNEPFSYYNVCSGVTETGYHLLYRLFVPLPGEYKIRLTGTNGLPAKFSQSGNLSFLCAAPSSWSTCKTIVSDTVLSLNHLSSGNYLLSFSSQDTIPFSPLIESFCHCPIASNGRGLMYGNGTAYLEWNASAYFDSCSIEMIPFNMTFTGIPNFVAYNNKVLISGLDTSLTYKFRLLGHCGAIQTYNWSDSFSVRLLASCNDIITLSCRDTAVILGGPGVFNFKPCESNTNGREFIFNVSPEFSGNYRLKATLIPSGSSTLHLSKISTCDQHIEEFNCIPGNQGVYNLGYLQEGESYLYFADQSNTQPATFALTLFCTIDNDQPNNVFFDPIDPTFVIPINDTCRHFGNRFATDYNIFPQFPDPDASLPPGNWYDSPDHSVWFAFFAPPSGTVRINVSSYHTASPFDPQAALVMFGDSLAFGFKLLATGEDSHGPHPADAELNYTGLTPGKKYFILVDGAFGTSGRFCITIRDEPEIWTGLDTCQQFIQPSVAFDAPGSWRNLYAGSSAHVTGPLLGAIQTTDNLGVIKVSCQIMDEAPVLPNGQKVLPRYFHIETQFQPINPLTLRLFFTAADLEAYNLTPPFSSTLPFELGLTHYDGDQEDCDPTNNSLTAGLAVSPSNVVLLSSDSIFYLEAVFDDFSEFGAAMPFTVNVSDISDNQFLMIVYPNPSEGIFRIRMPNKFIGENLDYLLVDVLGRPVRSGQIFLNQGTLESDFDFSTLTSGMYQLLVYHRGIILGRNKLLKM